MKGTTLRELAALLDLSPSTISKALNNSLEISEITKKRVRKAAKECGYVPNQMARNLKMGKTKSIGVVIPNVMHDFFGMVLHGIEKEASKKNYQIIICISDDKTRKEQESLKTLINGSVDGILISMAKETHVKGNSLYLNQLINSYNIPFVQFDRITEEIDCDKVSVDDFDGAYQATQYLMDTGCQNIAFLSPISDTHIGVLRREGYLKALESRVVKSSPILLEVNNYENFGVVIDEILANKVDGILAADEFSAFNTMNRLQSKGVKIPDDIAIIGFTNGKMVQSANPPITTVSQHADLIGKNALNMLIKRIEGFKTPTTRHKVIKTELTIRKSTKPLEASVDH